MLLDAPCATPPAIISVQPLGQRGAPGTPGGITWPSRAAAAADAIPASLPAIRLQGYQFPGDGGEATYVRIAAPGTPAAYQFRSQDGAWWELAERRPHVAQFGALGTGAAETAALQAAIIYGRDRGRRVYFGAATYVSATLTVYDRTSLKGEGRSLTTLRLAAGTNADLIVSDGFAGLTGSILNEGPENVEIRDMCLDGNRAGNTFGRCLAIFGASPVLERLWIFNAPQDGLHTEWGRSGEPVAGMEGSFNKLKIWRSGRHNWNFAGPHDSHASDIICISASLSGQGAGNNLNIVGETNGRFSHVHCWQEGASPRSAYGAYVGGYGASTFDGCHFEGALIPVGIFSSKNAFSPSCNFYAAAGGTTILLGGAVATQNTICGQVQDKHPGSADVVAVKFRSDTGDYIANNRIELLSFVQNAGQVDYGTKSGGGNIISINGFAASGYDWTGTPHQTDIPLREIRVSGGVQSVYGTSAPPRVAAAIAFNAATGAILSRSNVKSLTKVSAGQWRIVFAEKVPSGAKAVGTASPGADHVNVLSAPYGNGETEQDVVITRTDTEARSDSAAFVSVVIIAPSA